MKTYRIIVERSTETEYFVMAESEEDACQNFIDGDYVVEGETEIVTSESNPPEVVKND